MLSKKITCWNCGKEFIKFRKENPFKHTCKTCIMNAWHIPYEDRIKYCNPSNLFKFLEKKSPIVKPKPNKATTLKNSKNINILEFNMNLSKKELEMIKVCSQLDNCMRYSFYHRIEAIEPQNEWLKYLKNW